MGGLPPPSLQLLDPSTSCLVTGEPAGSTSTASGRRAACTTSITSWLASSSSSDPSTGEATSDPSIPLPCPAPQLRQPFQSGMLLLFPALLWVVNRWLSCRSSLACPVLARLDATVRGKEGRPARALRMQDFGRRGRQGWRGTLSSSPPPPKSLQGLELTSPGRGGWRWGTRGLSRSSTPSCACLSPGGLTLPGAELLHPLGWDPQAGFWWVRGGRWLIWGRCGEGGPSGEMRGCRGMRVGVRVWG